MPVVCTEDDIIFAGVLQYVSQVIIRLAGHVDPIVPENVAMDEPCPAFPYSNPHIVQDVRDPLRTDLNESPPQVRKLGWHALHDEIVKSTENRELPSQKQTWVLNTAAPAPRGGARASIHANLVEIIDFLKI